MNFLYTIRTGKALKRNKNLNLFLVEYRTLKYSTVFWGTSLAELAPQNRDFREYELSLKRLYYTLPKR